MKKSRKQRREERKAVKRLERKLTKPKPASFSVSATTSGGTLMHEWRKGVQQRTDEVTALREYLAAERMEQALSRLAPRSLVYIKSIRRHGRVLSSNLGGAFVETDSLNHVQAWFPLEDLVPVK